MTPELGLVEGRFGKPYSWPERLHLMQTLARAGFAFYHYGPKADPFLRRRWRRTHPQAEKAALTEFGDACRARHVRFGIALTPMDIGFPLDRDTRNDLERRIRDIDELGIDDLVILFDDQRGDLPRLAQVQADVVDLCAQITRAQRIFFCPTYYSCDPVLDRVFGKRPDHYLADLGKLLDPSVRIYWTGPEVCSREISIAHLRTVERELGRAVCLWDNYPANDGARMSRFLHLRAFGGRYAGIGHHLSGHAVNPALQPSLSCLPAWTLVESYKKGADYDYAQAFQDCARQLFGEQLARFLTDDLVLLQDVGIERLGDHHARLRERYAALEQPAAREIVAWLDGSYTMTDDEVRTQ